VPSTRRQDKKRVPFNSSRSLLSPAPPLICVGGGAQFWSIVTTRKLRNSLAYPSCKPQKVGSIVSSLEFHSQLAQTRLQKAPLVGIDIARLLPSQEWGTSNNQRQTTYTPKEGIMHRLRPLQTIYQWKVERGLRKSSLPAGVLCNATRPCCACCACCASAARGGRSPVVQRTE
jgi:hypothetical protein